MIPFQGSHCLARAMEKLITVKGTWVLHVLAPICFCKFSPNVSRSFHIGSCLRLGIVANTWFPWLLSPPPCSVPVHCVPHPCWALTADDEASPKAGVMSQSTPLFLPRSCKAGLSEFQCLPAILVKKLCKVWHGCPGPSHTHTHHDSDWFHRFWAQKLSYLISRGTPSLIMKSHSLRQRHLSYLFSPWDELSPRRLLTPSAALAPGSWPTISLHKPGHIPVWPQTHLSTPTCSSYTCAADLCSYWEKRHEGNRIFWGFDSRRYFFIYTLLSFPKFKK